MITKLSFIIMILLPFSLFAQNQNNNSLNQLSFLVENDWLTTGAWNNRTHFKQKSSAEWGLNGTIIKINQTGIINMETGERGVRNEAIITFNKKENKIEMYVFDIYGGITKTNLVFENDAIHFEYPYYDGDNEVPLKDTWSRIDNDTFEFTIKAKNNDTWETKLLEGKMIRVPKDAADN